MSARLSREENRAQAMRPTSARGWPVRHRPPSDDPPGLGSFRRYRPNPSPLTGCLPHPPVCGTIQDQALAALPEPGLRERCLPASRRCSDPIEPHTCECLDALGCRVAAPQASPPCTATCASRSGDTTSANAWNEGRRIVITLYQRYNLCCF